jgi:hypothetical protein
VWPRTTEKFTYAISVLQELARKRCECAFHILGMRPSVGGALGNAPAGSAK